jgi:signal peptidase I
LLREILGTIVLIIIIYAPINLMTARAVIEGPSMQPNFYTGQLVVVNRMAYFLGQPQRGDVVVLHSPIRSTDEDLIKRVIGLPGETVTIRHGRVYINGALLNEPYIKEYCERGCDGQWTLGTQEYFVLGDNRDNSYDGHNFGPIHRSLIVGQAWIRYWPIQDLEVIPHPSYGNLSTPQTLPRGAY